MRLRSATEADLPVLRRLCVHTRPWGDYGPYMAEWLALPGAWVRVVELDGGDGVVALAVAVPVQVRERPWLEFRLLIVDPVDQRRGFGDALVEDVQAQAWTSGADGVFASCADDNEACLRMLCKRGFVPSRGPTGVTYPNGRPMVLLQWDTARAVI